MIVTLGGRPMNRHADGVSLGVLLALSALISACASPQAVSVKTIDRFTPMWSYSRAVPAFWWYGKTQIDAMHGKGKTGDTRTVAILDSGFMAKQLDVNPSRVDPSGMESCTGNNNKDFDDTNGHGTAMAVIALGDDKGNKTGGIATKAKLLPIKIVCGVSTADSVTRGVDIAIAAKVDVILLALGPWPSDVDVITNKTVHDRLLDKVTAANTNSPTTLFVVASVWDATTYKFPDWTKQVNVILVAAMTLDGAAEVFYSEKGGDIWAPGRDVETAFIDYGDPKYPGKYGDYLMQGTSAAAAIVAGCAAAIKDPGEKAADLKTRLTTKFVNTKTLPGGKPRLDCVVGLP
jgi:Subtilase family